MYKRQLILTDKPRLFYVEPKTKELKGEIEWINSIPPEFKKVNLNIFYY